MQQVSCHFQTICHAFALRRGAGWSWGGGWAVSVAAGDEKSADFWRMWSMVWAATV